MNDSQYFTTCKPQLKTFKSDEETSSCYYKYADMTYFKVWTYTNKYHNVNAVVLCERLYQYSYVSSHVSQVDIKYLYADMLVPATMVDHVVPCASWPFTAIQAGDSATAESLPLVPGYHHTTTRRHLEM